MILFAICILSLACALLSVIVIARRWAFIGEGISHAAFGGAGTAWILFLAFPALATAWVFQISIVLFCWITAALIAGFSRSQRTGADAIIGIFMVASLAWGFLAERIYLKINHSSPFAFDETLYGNLQLVSPTYALVTIAISLAVIAILVLFGKEIVYYCLDPVLAEVSGVPAGFIHYLLLILLALVITIGVRLIGAVLFTALLVFPGATASLLSKRLTNVLILSSSVALIGAISGIVVSLRWRFLPEGPCIVLSLFVMFLGVFAITRRTRRSQIAG